jgi:hypothetical protein
MALHEGQKQVTAQFLGGLHLQKRVHELAEALIVYVLKQ